LVPAHVKNRRNEPANLIAIAKSLSDMMDLAEDQVVAATTANAERALGRLLHREMAGTP
jgi:Tat protein secretion system quality control protein TatD with DNase activity